MNPELTARSPSVRDALYELSMSMDVPDAQALDDVVRRYPEFADELTDFAIELALDCLGEASDAGEPIADPTSVSPVVSRAMSKFHNRLHALRQAVEQETSAPSRAGSSEPFGNPLAQLSRTEFRAFAKGIGANTLFAAKLRDRQIAPDTISAGFKQIVSDELKVPIELVAAHFSATGGARTAGRQYYKADDGPKHDQCQSFADVVRTSGLTDEEQKRLLSL